MPDLKENPSPSDLLDAYDEGYVGWIFDKGTPEVKARDAQERWEQFCSTLPSASALIPNLKDSHKEVKRCLLYLSRKKYDPDAFSEEAQTTGDCVSHGSRNARDVTRCVEIHIKGESEDYFKRGATEPSYGARGHGGQGADPGRIAQFEKEYGFLVRQEYADLRLDLSKYDSSIGDRWGRGGVPANVKAECKFHNVGSLVVPENADQALDLLANGYAAHSGQSWGTSSKQPKDGINRGPSPRWGHDMATVGYDLTCEFFKEEVAFVPNSWGEWNQPNPVWLANQDVYGPWIPGMIVVALEEWVRYFVDSGSIYHYSNVKGFPAQTLPNYGAEQIIS